MCSLLDDVEEVTSDKDWKLKDWIRASEGTAIVEGAIKSSSQGTTSDLEFIRDMVKCDKQANCIEVFFSRAKSGMKQWP